jgi:hypothetical protein
MRDASRVDMARVNSLAYREHDGWVNPVTTIHYTYGIYHPHPSVACVA